MSKPNNGQLTTFSQGTTITGDVIVENDIRIAGTLKGTVNTTGHLIVEQTGLIEGTVKAQAATIAGKIEGNIDINEKLILESKATVKGDIRTKFLVIEDGASYTGNCASMGGKAG